MENLILATVNYGKAQITQCWKLQESDQGVYIVLHEANDGKIVIPLKMNLIKQMSDEIIAPRKSYNGVLKAADAINLKSDTESSG